MLVIWVFTTRQKSTFQLDTQKHITCQSQLVWLALATLPTFARAVRLRYRAKADFNPALLTVSESAALVHSFLLKLTVVVSGCD